MITDTKAIERMRTRAADLVGTPWRLLGRDPGAGLDCIGVLLEIYRAGGIDLPDLDPLGIHDEPHASPLWEWFDPAPVSRHGMPADVALWPVDDDGSRWSAHVAVVFGNQLVTSNEARGVHAVDLRRHLTAIAKVGRPKPRWFRIRPERVPA